MTLPKPFEHPLVIGETDCLVTVRVTSYTPPGGDNWNEPRYDAEVEYEIIGIRMDAPEYKVIPLSGEVATLIGDCAELEEACFEAIDDANQPPEFEREPEL